MRERSFDQASEEKIREKQLIEAYAMKSAYLNEVTKRFIILLIITDISNADTYTLIFREEKSGKRKRRKKDEPRIKKS